MPAHHRSAVDAHDPVAGEDHAAVGAALDHAGDERGAARPRATVVQDEAKPVGGALKHDRLLGLAGLLALEAEAAHLVRALVEDHRERRRGRGDTATARDSLGREHSEPALLARVAPLGEHLRSVSCARSHGLGAWKHSRNGHASGGGGLLSTSLGLLPLLLLAVRLRLCSTFGGRGLRVDRHVLRLCSIFGGRGLCVDLHVLHGGHFRAVQRRGRTFRHADNGVGVRGSPSHSLWPLQACDRPACVGEEKHGTKFAERRRSSASLRP